MIKFKEYPSTVTLFLFGWGLLFFSWVGCNTMKGISAPSVPSVVYIVKHDTLYPKPLTEAEKEKLAHKFFQNGFNEFVQPGFQKQENTIGRLSKSVHDLSYYLIQTRHRTDSIAKERNYYRQQVFNFQKETQQASDTTVKYQKELLKMLNEKHKEDTRNIQINFILAVSCLVGLLILVVLWSSLYFTVRHLKKKLDNLPHV